MSDPIVLSDDEKTEEDLYATPPLYNEKKRRAENRYDSGSVFVIDDDPTPQKPRLSDTPLVVEETPLSNLVNSDVSTVKCTFASRGHKDISSFICLSDNECDGGLKKMNEDVVGLDSDGISEWEPSPFRYQESHLSKKIADDGCTRASTFSERGSVGASVQETTLLKGTNYIGNVQLDEKVDPKKADRLSNANANIYPGYGVEENESDEELKKMNEVVAGLDSDGISAWEPSPFCFKESLFSTIPEQIADDGCICAPNLSERVFNDAHVHETMLKGDNDTKKVQLDENVDPMMENRPSNAYAKRNTGYGVDKKKQTKEEKMKLLEEKKLKKEQEKLQKVAMKMEEAERKKLEKEKKKWENGKFALKSIVADVDRKVVEQGSIGGPLLARFAEKGLKFRVTSNPIERSIIWTMDVPEELAELTSSQRTEIQYISVIFEAAEFCNLVINNTFMDHVYRVQTRYPTYTVCYITNRLMSYIHKREQEQYKHPDKTTWRRPPVEEVLAKLTTHCCRVHSRLCLDEAELAEHVVGLTSSLASCQFRNKLTRLTVNANGSMIPKDFADKNLIKKNMWLKALVAIPKVQPRFAIAIWKKYPTMRSLLKVYMDRSKTVHEKEFLLKDLVLDGLLGDQRRLGEVCSKRVYRILMAQSASIKTDDVELGADFFTGQRS